MTGVVDVVVEDADEAGAVGSRLFYPQELTVLRSSRPFAMTLHGGSLGPVFLGLNHFDADVRIDCGELLTSYHVNLPLTGRLSSRHRGHEVEANPGLAAVYSPRGETVLSRWESGCTQLCVKMDRDAVETALRAHLGGDVADGYPDLDDDLDVSLDVSVGAGRSWASLARALNDQLGRADGVLLNPVVAAPLADGLIRGLLVATSRAVRSAQDRPFGPVPHPSVRRAMDHIHEHAAEPITVGDLAVHCGLSVRALQEGFLRHLGQPPLAYLRAVRLRRAHRDLLDADPSCTTVATVAHRWGHTHLGRFAAAHLAVYGEAPAATLHRRTS